MIAAIFLRLAKGKGDVDAGHVVNVRRRELGLEPGKFIIAEGIGLQICETIPGIPLPRRNLGCSLIGGDGILCTPIGLQGMSP